MDFRRGAVTRVTPACYVICTTSHRGLSGGYSHTEVIVNFKTAPFQKVHQSRSELMRSLHFAYERALPNICLKKSTVRNRAAGYQQLRAMASDFGPTMVEKPSGAHTGARALCLDICLLQGGKSPAASAYLLGTRCSHYHLPPRPWRYRSRHFSCCTSFAASPHPLVSPQAGAA